MRARRFYVYIMANTRNNVLYTGFTNDLKRRVYEHKHDLVEAFTKRYRVHKLVYYEFSEVAYSAIRREKQIKGGSRADKLKLVASMNPDWRDLYDDLTRVHRIEIASHALAMTTESSRQVVLEIFKRH